MSHDSVMKYLFYNPNNYTSLKERKSLRNDEIGIEFPGIKYAHLQIVS